MIFGIQIQFLTVRESAKIVVNSARKWRTKKRVRKEFAALISWDVH